MTHDDYGRFTPDGARPQQPRQPEHVQDARAEDEGESWRDRMWRSLQDAGNGARDAGGEYRDRQAQERQEVRYREIERAARLKRENQRRRELLNAEEESERLRERERLQAGRRAAEAQREAVRSNPALSMIDVLMGFRGVAQSRSAPVVRAASPRRFPLRGGWPAPRRGGSDPVARAMGRADKDIEDRDGEFCRSL